MEEEIAMVLRRFGDEQSTLLDQFERLSFQVQLNQAMLCRSLSEPAETRTQPPPPPPTPPLTSQVQQGRRHRGFSLHKVLKKLIKPILGGKSERNGVVANPKDRRSWKVFSRSLRV